MNNWGQQNYQLQHGISLNMITNPLLPLTTPIYTMPEVTSMNPPPSVPIQLFSRSEKNSEGTDTAKTGLSRRNSERRESHERSNNQRRDRDRDRDRSSYRSQDRDFKRYERNDSQDQNNSRNKKERRTKWDDGKKEEVATVERTSTMTHSGMGSYQNMMANNVMASNMMHTMTNMMVQPNMEQNQMPSMMAQMNMMPNMMEQNIIMNQQLLAMAGQPIYISSGVIMPPIPGTQSPAYREKPKGCRTVFVSGLPKKVTNDTVKEIFQRFGQIAEVNSPRNGAFFVRFQKPQSLEQALALSSCRYKLHDQTDNEASTFFIDYALNEDDQLEYEKSQRLRELTPPLVEPFSPAALAYLADKLKIEEEFPHLAPRLAAWLERGECTKKYANTFYSLIQVTNNQSRRLFSEKMQFDDEFQSLKATYRDRYARVLVQLEQVAKILSVAKRQRVSDHFTKQQRRSIDLWLKMTEEVENFREEFQAVFEEDINEKVGKNMVPLKKYEELKTRNENLTYELEGYKNEAHLMKEEAESKFEKFKAHFIAEQALQNDSQEYPPLSDSSILNQQYSEIDERKTTGTIPPSEAKLISMLTAFLLVHPLGASIDHLTSYVKTLVPNVVQFDVQMVLQKYEDVFQCKVTNGGNDHIWTFAVFDMIKQSN